MPTSASRYSSSLKDGISDGFLTPFRVKQISATLDEYVYTPDDKVVDHTNLSGSWTVWPCTDQLEQRAAEQLHKVFTHHGHGQCGASGGYELRFDTGSVYVTDNFFAVAGCPQPKDHFLSVRRFEEKLSNIQLSHPCTTTAEGDKILTIRREGETRYIMLRVTNDQTAGGAG